MNELPLRVAIVSDPLVQRGGAERVVEAMARTFPDAPIFAVLYSPETGPRSLRDRVTSSYLGRIPWGARRHRWLLPFFPAAIEGFDLRSFDVIISSHHTMAKGLIRGTNAVHICYCHTPMRALWERTHEELATLPALLRPIAAAIFRRLRIWDVVTVPRVDVFLANSQTTRLRIQKHYGREALLVFPPIDIDRFTPGDEPPGDYYLVASRLVPYKRVDLAFDAARLAGRKLVIVGDGPGRAALAARGADLRGHVSDAELVALMRGARALIFPQYEDFGMTPVEMMACGRPVIALGTGGAAETVLDGETGILVPEQTPEAFAEGIRRFESLTFTPQVCRRRAEAFAPERFQTALREAVAAAAAGIPRRPVPASVHETALRVLQVSEATLGGTRRYLEDVFEALGGGPQFGLVYSLRRADASFTVLLDKMRAAGWRLFEIDMRREINPLADVASTRALRDVYRSFAPDIVHAHSSKAGALARIATLGMQHRPGVVYSPHSIASNVSWIYGLIEKVLALRADVICAVTPSERDELLHLGLLPAGQIRVVVPTIPATFAPRDREEARRVLGLGAFPIVVASGRLTLQKDPLAFAEVVSALRRRVPGVRAYWVGDGELRGALEGRIAELGLQECLTITGWLDDIRVYIAAADVVVSTSRYESFGYVTAETFAMERPIVASAITGTIDIVLSDTAELLFSVDDVEGAADRAAYLLDNRERAVEIAQRGRANVATAFSPAATRNGLLGAYGAAIRTG